jgi:hypothetical protein
MHADFPATKYCTGNMQDKKKKGRTHGTGLLEDAQNHPKTIRTRTEAHLASSLLCAQQLW